MLEILYNYMSADFFRHDRTVCHAVPCAISFSGRVYMKFFSFFTDKRNIVPIAVISVAILFTAILIGYCAFSFLSDGANGKSPENLVFPGDDSNGSSTVGNIVNGDIPAITVDKENELRGVWIATIMNINYPSEKGVSAEQMASEIDAITENCERAGFNAIFFQVRPSGDAFYPSDIFPWSEYLTGEQGKAPEKGFDPLAYFIKKAHERNISLHAWINPYRITSGSTSSPKHDVTALSANHPARLHPEYTVAYGDGKLYFNPGLPEVRELCVNGVKELVENYPSLDGIHFDDYFYPYPVSGEEFDDTAAYEKYGGGMELGDWRRENVAMLIREVYSAIKELNPECRFGVSPFGIWANSGSDTYIKGSDTNGLESYFSLYCDPIAWANEGIVDYLAPQIYWSFTSDNAPFDTLARWWNANLDGTGVDMYIGHAAYKAEDFAENEIPLQAEFGRSLMCCKGSIFYGYADIAENKAGLMESLSKMYSSELKYKPASHTGEPLRINSPENDSTVEYQTVFLMGTSDPSYPVTRDGEKLSRTKNGYFSIYETLTEGVNKIAIEQNGTEYVHTVTKKTSSDTPVKMDEYAIGKTSPSGESWVMSGEKLNLTVQAPAGSKVMAYIGDVAEVELKPTIGFSANDGLTIEVYKGSVTIPETADENTAKSLGELRFVATNGNKTATKTAGEVKELADGAFIYAEVINDYTELKISPTSSFYSDYTPINAGMRDYVTGLEGDYYRLKFGGYVSRDSVKITEGQKLAYNTVSDVKVKSVCESALNNKENYTEVSFGISENTPVDMKVSGDEMRVTFFEANNESVPKITVGENPMISEITAEITDDGIVFVLKLVSEYNYYGCNGTYLDGSYVIRLNNPQMLADGDKPLSGKTIVVDAGHGGADSGAVGPVGKGGDCKNEAELNLAAALELQKLLEDNGAEVIMMRTDDSTVELLDRAKRLSEMMPDLEISVHHNSIDTTVNASKVRGTLALYSNAGGKLIAKKLSESMSSSLGKLNRGYDYQKLAVARNHRFPSALCEVCFVSNPEEYQWAVADGNAERTARAIYDGIIDYYKAQSDNYIK